MQNLVEDITISERQWKRLVRIKFARHMIKSGAGVPSMWNATLRRYGVRDNGSVLPSTSDQLERANRNDERTARTEVALAEVSKE